MNVENTSLSEIKRGLSPIITNQRTLISLSSSIGAPNGVLQAALRGEPQRSTEA